MPDFSLELALYEKGYTAVCGVDEAGRGPLSGPVVAAACILPPGLQIEGLDDSKKLSPKKRDALFDTIKENALAYAIASASPAEIDEINILNATMLAMRRAVAALSVPADAALIDGNIARDFPIFTQTVIKGDAISCSIAAASILAKVTRDRICLEDDKAYPEYQFAKHKGYSTALHMEILRKIGPSPIHRRSFLKFLDE
ncbi:MAG: ribonuclease HII [Clostridia bacterium]|nr:ribonuclease HII [Clostridia bacterium]